MRLGVLACALCLLAGFGSASASAASLPPEGIFESCTLDTEMSTCIQRLEVVHQGGLQVVVIPAYGASLSSLTQYTRAAQALGMSVMWELGDSGWWRDPPTSDDESGSFSAFASACGCQEDAQLLPFVVHWLSQLPATYGYYAADDSSLSPGDHAGVAGYIAAIKQQDPTHTVMIGSADESQTQQYENIPDVIGTEIYPVTTSSLMPAGANQDMWDAVGQEAGDAQRFANEAGKQSAFILQAFPWGDNLDDGQAIGVCTPSDSQQSCYDKLLYPSGAAQLQLRNEVLSHAHPKLILWFNFAATDGGVTGNSFSIFPSASVAAARWDGLSAAVQAPFPASPKARPHIVAAGRVRAHEARKAHVSRHNGRPHHGRRLFDWRRAIRLARHNYLVAND